MRLLHALAALALGCNGFCQSPSGTRPFAAIHPDMTIVVRKHSTGADIVEATALAPDYPADLMRSQFETLGRLLDAPLNGLKVYENQVDSENKSMSFLKATCGAFGIWNQQTGALRLQEVVRAFAGAPKPHTVKGLSIFFEGLKPGLTTVKKLDNASVTLEAFESSQPQGVEYRIGLKTQDAASISIPTGRTEPTPPRKPSEGREGPPVFAWAAIGVAGLAAGVLVYLTLLRGRRSGA